MQGELTVVDPMKLTLRFVPDGELGRALDRVPELAACFDKTGMFLDFDSKDPRVAVVLALARARGEVDVRFLWSFAAEELEAAPAVRLLLRGPLVRESAPDIRANESALTALPAGTSLDGMIGSRWLSEIRLSAWKECPAKLCGLGGLPNHWLLERPAAEALATGLSGITLGVVRDRTGAPRASPVLLVAGHRAPPCSRLATYGQRAGEFVRLIGPLAYENTDALVEHDLWRSDEGWSDQNVGELLLSARGYSRWRSLGLTGAAFEPVYKCGAENAREVQRRLVALATVFEGVPGIDTIAPLKVLLATKHGH